MLDSRLWRSYWTDSKSSKLHSYEGYQAWVSLSVYLLSWPEYFESITLLLSFENLAQINIILDKSGQAGSMLGQYSMHINDDQKILCNVFKISVC